MSNWSSGTAEGRLGSEFEGLLEDNLTSFSFSGPLVVTTGSTRFLFPIAVTIIGVSASASTAPTGASVIVDVNKNGTTIYTTQANRPAIAASAFSASETTPDVTAMAVGDYLTVDVDQVGSTIAGSDLNVVIRYRNA